MQALSRQLLLPVRCWHVPRCDPRVSSTASEGFALRKDVCRAAAATAALGVVLLQAVLAIAVIDAPLPLAGQHFVRCNSGYGWVNESKMLLAPEGCMAVQRRCSSTEALYQGQACEQATVVDFCTLS